MRELKAKLSEYVKQAATGTTIVVTDRGKPVARLVGLSQHSSIQQGVQEGWIEPARRDSLTSPTPFESRYSISEVLDEDRG